LCIGDSTTIRSTEGIYLCQRAVTKNLISRYLLRLGLPVIRIAELLEPSDAQNVPAAVELLKELKRVETLFDNPDLSDVERGDIKAIAAYGEVFGSFVEAFTNFKLSLSDQMTLLSKYVHLIAWLYRDGKARSLPNYLYTDSATCVKNAFFSLAKQQIRDTTEPFFLFLLGTDGTEKLFALARMSGGHNPNFMLHELTRLLASGQDITRIFADHPELYSGHRRLSTERKEGVDHLAPSRWIGDAVAGHVDLIKVWNAGAKAAACCIQDWTNGAENILDWKSWWAKIPGSNILSPCGGGKYPGVQSSKGTSNTGASEPEEPDRSMDDGDLHSARLDNLFSTLPDAARQGIEQARAFFLQSPAVGPEVASPASEEDPAEIRDIFDGADSDLQEDTRDDHPEDEPLKIDESNGQSSSSSSQRAPSERDVELYAKRRAHSLWVDGKWVHLASAIRLIFNTIP
jgi:hypothetical protein